MQNDAQPRVFGTILKIRKAVIDHTQDVCTQLAPCNSAFLHWSGLKRLVTSMQWTSRTNIWPWGEYNLGCVLALSENALFSPADQRRSGGYDWGLLVLKSGIRIPIMQLGDFSSHRVVWMIAARKKRFTSSFTQSPFWYLGRWATLAPGGWIEWLKDEQWFSDIGPPPPQG